ncbi:hypothetical protein HK105_200951 [Polyrhizophydium stewartii]|uniref:Uncharacterized protein n=1 Tax=Polyrhizophydium stewartii TaxID=2732419 RepID=A0ABR4NIF4_9FUNG
MTPTPGLPLPAPRANLPKAHQRHLRAIIRQSLEELYLPTDPWLQVLADIGLQVAQDLPFVLDTLASIADDGGDSDSDSDSDGSEYDADADVESYRGRARRRPWSPPPTREQRIAAGPPLLPPRAGVRSRALGGGVSAADLKQRLHHVITVHTEPGTPGSSSYVPGSAEPLPARAGGRRPDPRLADIGGRVVLRGDPKQISKLADVAELIVFVACHQKLEFYLLRDMLVRIELPSGPRTGSGTSINSVASIASIGSAVSGMSAASAATAPAPRSRNSLFAWLWQSRIPQVPGIDADAAAASSSGDETDQVAPIRPYDPQLAALVSPHTSDLSRRQPRPRSIFGLASGGQPSPEAASPHVSPDNLFARAVNQIELAALSASPGVRFPPPLLLVRLRDQEALDSAAASAASLASLSSPMLPSLTELEPPANSQADPSLDASSGSPGSQAAILPAPHPASAAVSSTAQSPRSRKTLSTATALSRRSRIPADSKAGLAYLIKNNNSIGGVRRHQAISVAFSYFWDLKSTIPCRPPKVYTIRYYDKATESLQDRTLGQYIEMMCRDADAPCHDASCEHAMGEHQMEYHHGHGCVRVRMETADDGVLDDRSTQIYVWTQCAECGATSSMIPISLASWHVSFGKFLELLLYHSSLHPADMCEHISSSRQAVQHRFRCGRRTVVFEYAPMDLFEMRVPRIKVDPDYTFNAATSTSSSLSLGAPSAEQVQHLQSEIRSFYRSLTSYLTQLMTAVEPPGKSATPKAEAETIEPPTPKQSAPKIKPSRHASERLSEMLQDMVSMFPDEESHFIDAAQASSDLNQLRRMLCERIRERIESIETFHSDFVPDTACPHSWALPEYYDWHRGSLHLIPSSSVIVREDEPGSIIAFTLRYAIAFLE